MPTQTAPSTKVESQHAETAVLQVAERLYAMNPEWVVFFREVLGLEGIVRRTFSEPDALMRFECSPQYARIREMLDSLRARQRDAQGDTEPLRIVTVRMPKSLHATLKSEARERKMSINTLCISKLMQLLDSQGRDEASTAPTPAGTRATSGRQGKRTGADL